MNGIRININENKSQSLEINGSSRSSNNNSKSNGNNNSSSNSNCNLVMYRDLDSNAILRPIVLDNKKKTLVGQDFTKTFVIAHDFMSQLGYKSTNAISIEEKKEGLPVSFMQMIILPYQITYYLYICIYIFMGYLRIQHIYSG